MNDFNTKTLLKSKPIVTKQLLALRDNRSAPAGVTQQPEEPYKQTLQLKPRNSEQISTGKTVLDLRRSRCDSGEVAFSRTRLLRSRPCSPHSISSGYATEDPYQSDHHSHDGDSDSHYPHAGFMKDYCEYCFAQYVRRSKTELKPMPRCHEKGPWRSHMMLNQKGLVACPILYSRVCGICGATGAHAHIVEHCPLRRLRLLNLG